ncbi:MAG: Ig-like domain-containing protein [Deltaproteobacteria bacterium]|nr:Ig-like domain-containing protein [Deltaproteobacteria bacterium]
MTATPPALLERITVTPPNPSIGAIFTQQFAAVGSYSDGTDRNITGEVTWGSSAPAIATISSTGLATAVAAGSTTISATLEGETGATTLTVTTGPAVDSIELSPTNPSIGLYSTQPFTAVAKLSDDTTLEITDRAAWSSSNPATASISSAGLATAVAVGSTTISAAFAGKTGFTTMTVTDATLSSIALSPTDLTIAVSTTQPFTAVGTYSDGTTQDITTQVTWASSTIAVATISSTGVATAASVGSTNISATFGGVTQSTTLTVTAATLASIALNPTNPSIAVGSTQQFSAVGTYSDGSIQDITDQVSWESSATETATISNAAGSKGLASGIAVGSAMISASLAGVAGSTTLTVTPATLESIAVTPASPSIAVRSTQQFVATGTYSDGTFQDITDQVAWTSSTIATATISNAAATRGLATGVAAGSTQISAALAGKTGSATLTVIVVTLASIEVTPDAPTIAKRTTVQFTATGTYSDGSTLPLTNVTWRSSATGVATISNTAGSKGLATGVAAGATTITATLGAISGEATLKVTSATLVSLAVNPSTPSIAKGTKLQFTATGTFSDSSTQVLTTVTWSSSAVGVATISNTGTSKGLATGVSMGETTIRATSGTISGSTRLTVSAAALTQIDIDPPNATLAKGLNRQFTATGIFSDLKRQDLTAQVTWSSGDAAIATISNAAGSQGLASSVGVGVTSISATLSGITGTTNLTIIAGTLTSIAVTPATSQIAKGTTQSFVATGTYTDSTTLDVTTQVTWSSSDARIATISNVEPDRGLATAKSNGAVTIRATLGAIRGSASLTVTAAALVSLAVTPATPSVARGTTQRFTVTGTYTDGSTQNLTNQATWSSSDEVVASISNATGSKGLATALSLGTTTILAAFQSKSASTELTVKSAAIASIAVTPANQSIARNTTLRYTATATFTDGSTQDISTEVTWAATGSVGGSPVASISNSAGSQGMATGLIAGTARITATDATSRISGSTNLTVR